MVKLKDMTTTKRIGVVGAVVASAAGMVFAAAPASAAVAANPTSSFSIVYGASYYKGTVTFYNRSAQVTGAFKATGCRRVYAQAWSGATWKDWASSSTWCDRADQQPLSLTADVAGGATEVDVWMTSSDPYDGLEYVACYRGNSVCDGPYAGRPYVPPLDG